MAKEEESALEVPSPNDSNAMEELLKQADVPAQPDEELEEEQTPAKEEEAVEPESKEEEPKEEEEESSEEEEKTETKEEEKIESELQQKPNETDEEWEARIDKIKPKRGASEKTRSAIREVKQFAKEERKERRRIEREFNELQTKVSKGEVLTDEQKKKYEEAVAFRQAFDIEHDPEFNQKFDTQIQRGEENLLGLLRKWNLPESAAKYIKENGGVVKFRNSSELMPESITKVDGTRITHAEWWREKIDAHLTPAQKEVLSDELLNLRQLSRQRHQAVAEAQANREGFLQKRQQETEAAAKDWQDRVMKHADKVLPQYGEIAKMKEVPANASEAEKEAINKHNARFEQARKIAETYVTEITPEHLVEAAIAMGYVTIMKDELKAQATRADTAEARVKELEDQINGIKASGKTINKGKVTPSKEINSSKRVSDEDAMAEMIKTV